jgi:hypothetical protein
MGEWGRSAFARIVEARRRSTHPQGAGERRGPSDIAMQHTLAPTLDSIRTLIGHEAGTCVSIYLPTRPGGSADDRAAYAGELRKIRAEFSATESRATVDQLLAPLEQLNTTDLWQHASEGLCVFRSAGLTAHWNLPVKFPERTVVASTFHIRPLLDFVHSNQRFFVVVLTSERVALLKGSATGLSNVPLASLPKTWSQVVPERERERLHGMHSAGRGNTVHHAGPDDRGRMEDEARFVRAVHHALREALRDEHAPILLAGAERLVHQLRALSPIDGASAAIGNVAHETLTELHARAWPIARQLMAEKGERVKDRWGGLWPRGRAIDDIGSIARCAVTGRVRDLLIQEGSTLWGVLDHATGGVELHEHARVGHEEDVLDDLAEAVLMRGGEVHSLAKGEMPSGSVVAATLRW